MIPHVSRLLELWRIAAHYRLDTLFPAEELPEKARHALAGHHTLLLANVLAQAQALMLLLAKYPDMLTAAARDFAPHDVTFYLRELAASYHSYYDAERILVDDPVAREARLALVAAVAQVLRNGLAVLGVSAPRKMTKEGST